MTTRPDLTDDEVDAICAGYRQHAAKVKHLKALGLTVHRRPNGRPLVARIDWDRRMGGTQDPAAAQAGTGGPRWSR